MSLEDKLHYLEQEKDKLWAKILELQELVSKKTSDYEAEAKISSANAKQFAEETENCSAEAKENLADLSKKLEAVNNSYNEIERLYNTIKQLKSNIQDTEQEIEVIKNTIENYEASISDGVNELQNLIDSKPSIEEKITKIDSIYKRSDDSDSKITALYKSISEKKKEIDAIYFEIFGYTEVNENGEDVEIDGLKKKLETTYLSLQEKIEESENKILLNQDNANQWFNKFTKENGEAFSKLKENWELQYKDVLSRIENLLPQALTVGLSFAYSEKKEAEEKESVKHARTFNYAIWGLVAISLIPFTISIISIINKISLEEVIFRVPRIVLAILPLYLPILWVAYSANRKMNLSKRLIEEYSHKEVLSKTFEGLSKQISTINDDNISSDLRIKLLYNILEVNSENPGKLISDYNKSDHPLMDALDKSIKLTNAVTKLAKIPGFTKLAATLAKKSDTILENETKKAEAGLESIASEKKD